MELAVPPSAAARSYAGAGESAVDMVRVGRSGTSRSRRQIHDMHRESFQGTVRPCMRHPGEVSLVSGGPTLLGALDEVKQAGKSCSASRPLTCLLPDVFPDATPSGRARLLLGRTAAGSTALFSLQHHCNRSTRRLSRYRQEARTSLLAFIPPRAGSLGKDHSSTLKGH